MRYQIADTGDYEKLYFRDRRTHYISVRLHFYGWSPFTYKIVFYQTIIIYLFGDEVVVLKSVPGTRGPENQRKGQVEQRAAKKTENQ